MASPVFGTNSFQAEVNNRIFEAKIWIDTKQQFSFKNNR